MFDQVVFDTHWSPKVSEKEEVRILFLFEFEPWIGCLDSYWTWFSCLLHFCYNASFFLFGLVIFFGLNFVIQIQIGVFFNVEFEGGC
jgi:hypothetical protein